MTSPARIPTAICNERKFSPSKFRRADTGVGLLAVDFVAGMSRETGRIPDAATQSCGYQIVDLLGIALECGSEKLPIANSAARSALYQRCASFIRNEMANPDLDPQTTAEANGISTRYLHKIFQEAGQSFGEFLRSARLERCRRNLCDPGSSALPIGEIAYRAGFRSQSHFSKLFKKRFALSPADARAAACFAQE
jgi:AraC-like DNA-binding protein